MFRITLDYPDGTPDSQKYFRSEGDHRLITPLQIRNGQAVGERLRIATRITPIEWLMLKLNLLR